MKVGTYNYFCQLVLFRLTTLYIYIYIYIYIYYSPLVIIGETRIYLYFYIFHAYRVDNLLGASAIWDFNLFNLYITQELIIIIIIIIIIM